jgi:hypothetical protein
MLAALCVGCSGRGRKREFGRAPWFHCRFLVLFGPKIWFKKDKETSVGRVFSMSQVVCKRQLNLVAHKFKPNPR